MQLTAVFMQVPEGYIGFVEELPGANTQGDTLEEARENLREIGGVGPRSESGVGREVLDRPDGDPRTLYLGRAMKRVDLNWCAAFSAICSDIRV